jgi:hypothetical protein
LHDAQARKIFHPRAFLCQTPLLSNVRKKTFNRERFFGLKHLYG